MATELATRARHGRLCRLWVREQRDRRQNRRDLPELCVVTHRMSLDDAPRGYDTFLNKEDECVKVVLTP
jgi:threonine dehydrogenase-like Zn-dependent dehydrogenase